jgi:hypothetical protein
MRHAPRVDCMPPCVLHTATKSPSLFCWMCLLHAMYLCALVWVCGCGVTMYMGYSWLDVAPMCCPTTHLLSFPSQVVSCPPLTVERRSLVVLAPSAGAVLGRLGAVMGLQEPTFKQVVVLYRCVCWGGGVAPGGHAGQSPGTQALPCWLQRHVNWLCVHIAGLAAAMWVILLLS